MLPTLSGRIQTRIVLLATIGSLVTLIVGPLVPTSAPLGTTYRDMFIILAAVAVLGIGWELIYHLLMQWRWEKDWPTLFGLLQLVPEGALIWYLLRANAIPGIVGTVTAPVFCIQFLAVWICVWLWANGPMRVVDIHWRFHGGRLV